MRPVKKRARQWMLFAHVVLSVGWMGAGAANIVLAGTAALTESEETRRVCYRLINTVDFALVIPLAFGSLGSGLLISLATKWRLLRYWWVLTKLALTIIVITFSTFGVGVWVEQSIAATSSGPATSPVAVPLVVGASANVAGFLFMTWASITKPLAENALGCRFPESANERPRLRREWRGPRSPPVGRKPTHPGSRRCHDDHRLRRVRRPTGPAGGPVTAPTGTAAPRRSRAW